jgi:hypothetical protein
MRLQKWVFSGAVLRMGDVSDYGLVVMTSKRQWKGTNKLDRIFPDRKKRRIAFGDSYQFGEGCLGL